ncbi:DDB1- and CUL4-associated factor 10 [Trichoplax sp. H2]|nr:DDB1- and CUL4-associated factor 10 [Trichoplax sp. H2]|eukprot:RDD44391.1 DDB1- and CUL4-associated factor 10 [Trichoplax sp. H2]
MLANYLKIRERGDRLSRSIKPYLYREFKSFRSVISNGECGYDRNSIFNVEFNPDGSCLLAACERRSILIFDCITHRKIKEIFPAHSDCVNVVRFLDNRLFISCSDDYTIAVWDFRNTKAKLTTLKGHRNWVKSIEYCAASKVLITSGFDDTIRVWDMNSLRSQANNEVTDCEVYLATGISRLKLSPDEKKLAIATVDGNLLIVRNLNINSLKDNLRPTYSQGKLIPTVISSEILNNPTSVKENEIKNSFEIIRTFPDELFDVSERCHRNGLYSMDFHPQSMNLITRFTLADDNYLSVLELLSVHGLNFSSFDRAHHESQLTHYKVEANFRPSVDYIKEISFGADGQVICSPYGFGVRLLSYDHNCCPYEFSEPLKRKSHYPTELNTLQLLHGHMEACLTSRWSPVHMLIASGGLDGNVIFHEPKIT